MDARKKARLAVGGAVGVGVALFISALFFDVATLERGTLSGIFVLLAGWMGIYLGQIGWVANLLIVVVWVLSFIAKRRTAVIAFVLSVFTLGIGLSSFVTMDHQEWNVVELHLHGELQSFGPGIYLWCVGLLSAPAAAALSLFLSPPADEAP